MEIERIHARRRMEVLTRTRCTKMTMSSEGMLCRSSHSFASSDMKYTSNIGACTQFDCRCHRWIFICTYSKHNKLKSASRAEWHFNKKASAHSLFSARTAVPARLSCTSVHAHRCTHGAYAYPDCFPASWLTQTRITTHALGALAALRGIPIRQLSYQSSIPLTSYLPSGSAVF